VAKKYGKWQVIDGFDEGGQAHLYRVKDSTTDEFLRIKDTATHDVFVLKRLKNINRISQFEQEIRAILELRNKDVLRIVDYNTADDKPYYVAEFCELGSLEKIGADTFRGNIEKAVSILLPITRALASAHLKGIFHRDIKPSNILLRADGTPVIGDFGICHMEGDKRVTLTDEAMGSVNYIAPEMESGRRLGKPTAATDVYSLGKVLYWMLSGGRIFARENHRERSLTEELNDQRFEHVHVLLDQTLVENPAARISPTDFWMELVKVQSLVVGRFAPLEPSIGIRCRFCGIGTYQRLHDDTLSVMGTKKGVYMVKASVMSCAHCGHIEWFRYDEARRWWDK